MLVEYLMVVGAVALVSVGMVVKLNGNLKDQFRREVQSVGRRSGGGGLAGGGTALARNQATVDQAVRDLQAGKRLTPDQKKALQDVGATSDKGLVTLSAGGAVTFTRASDGRTAKLYAEANSDKGPTAGGKTGIQKKFGNTKVEVNGDASTSGTKAGGSVEQTVLQRGPGKLAVGAETDSNGSSAVYGKAALEAGVKVPGVGEGKAELYAKAALNRLTPSEKVALEARLAARAAQLGETHEDRMRLLKINRERVFSGQTPLDRLPD